MKPCRAVIALSDLRLARALEVALLDLLPGFNIATGETLAGSGEVVVTTPMMCSLVECRGLSEAGTRVIVISPTALTAERRQYEAAGAFAYLPMAIETTAILADAVRRAFDPHQRAVVADALTAANHESSPSPCS